MTGTSSLDAAVTAGDSLLGELVGRSFTPPAPTMGKLARVRYTHKAMVDLIIEKPELSQNEIAAHFGYTPAWISNILASEAFQAELALRREEVIDPELRATIKERFEALVIQSLAVLQKKLNQPVVSDTVALRAAELGAKALGIGGHAPPPAPKETSGERLQRLASRMLVVRPLNEGEIKDVTFEEIAHSGPAGGDAVSEREGNGVRG